MTALLHLAGGYPALAALAWLVLVPLATIGRAVDRHRAREAADIARLTVELAPPRYSLTAEIDVTPIGARRREAIGDVRVPVDVTGEFHQIVTREFSLQSYVESAT